MNVKNLRDLLFAKEQEEVQVGGQVIAILRNEETGLYRVHKTRNIVTDAGDTYYAQSAAGETPTNTFDELELGTAGTPGKTADRSDFTPIASTQKAETATYPKTNDGDSDNTGAGVDIVTHQFAYAAGDFNNGAITHGWITNTTPGASEPLLTGFAFTGGSFAKTASDTLKVIVNHTFTGV
jgi:hypothetical protein